MRHAESRSYERTYGHDRQQRQRRATRNPSSPRSRPSPSTLEQFLKHNASGLTFLGVTLSVFVSKKFVIIPIAIALMLAQDTLGKAGLARAKEVVQS